MAKGSSWETYEEVAEYLLRECCQHLGLSLVDGKQLIAGNQTGTTWEIDAKGVKAATGETIIIECRRYRTSRLNQEHLAAIAYRIQDTGSGGGILVSPLPLQSGAEKVALAAKVTHVTLNENATKQDFLMKFLDVIRIGKYDQATANVSESVTITVQDISGNIVESRTLIDELREPDSNTDTPPAERSSNK